MILTEPTTEPDLKLISSVAIKTCQSDIIQLDYIYFYLLTETKKLGKRNNSNEIQRKDDAVRSVGKEQCNGDKDEKPVDSR